MKAIVHRSLVAAALDLAGNYDMYAVFSCLSLDGLWVEMDWVLTTLGHGFNLTGAAMQLLAVMHGVGACDNLIWS